jgi:hypothetical protein
MKIILTVCLLISFLNIHAQNSSIDTLHFGSDQYIGEVQNGKPNGKGKYYYTDGSLYDGNFKKGEYYGNGMVKWASGNSYSGEWKDSKMEGIGTKHWADGAVYTGEWKNDLCHGKGTIKYANGNSYTGDWKEDKMNGYGIMLYTDGGKYEGNWKSDEKDGNGMMTLASGYYKKGSFKNGYDDNVKYYNKTGNEVSYEEYRGNPKSGFDSVYYGKDKYIGNFENYQMNGKGIYIEDDGSKYEGDFVNGKYSGKGIKKWVSGDSYNGDWKDDKRDGIGTYTWANGETYTGSWENNTRNGEGTLKKTNGYYYTGKFKNGDAKNETYYTDKGEKTTFYLWNIEVKKLDFHTTASGIQYSTADMSEFTSKQTGLLGTFIIYSDADQFSKPHPNIFQIYGPGNINEQALFAKLVLKCNSYYKYSKYSWKPNQSQSTITKGWDLRAYTTKGNYTVDGEPY